KRKRAAGAWSALLKAAKWVNTNPRAAARISVEKKYLASNPELHTTAIGNLDYMPSVSGGEKGVSSAAAEMKIAGMLNPRTDLAALAKKAYVKFEGVDGAWVSSIHVHERAQ